MSAAKVEASLYLQAQRGLKGIMNYTNHGTVSHNESFSSHSKA